jgi:hypothetical protein
MGGCYMFFAIFYGSKDSQVNLMPFWLCFSIWMVYGLNDLFNWLGGHAKQIGVFAVIFISLLVRAFFLMPTMDLSGDMQARNFIDMAVKEIPENAIVIVNGDEETFSLWYAQAALGLRPDMVIVSEGLIDFDWYVKNLKDNYPDINIPEFKQTRMFEFVSANPSRKVCRFLSTTQVYCK